MTNRRSARKTSGAQHGYVMLALMAILGVAAITVYVSSLNATMIHNDQARKTNIALAIAKQALIAHAAANTAHPGALPCPDLITNVAGTNVPDDGIADDVVATDCPSYIGRLPWRTLGLPDLRDADGERLWYALSANFRQPANAATLGSLTVTGALAANSVSAIVFAPGNALGDQGFQQRSAGNRNTWSNYLESYKGANPVDTCAANSTTHRCLSDNRLYNDQLALITPADVFSVVERRVAREIALALQKYFASAPTTGTLPLPGQAQTAAGVVVAYPAMAAPPPPVPAVLSGYIPTDNAALNPFLPAWFDISWRTAFHYRVDSACTTVPADPACGSTALSGQPSGMTQGVLIGGSGGTYSIGTKAVLGFDGVSPVFANFATTILQVAVQ